MTIKLYKQKLKFFFVTTVTTCNTGSDEQKILCSQYSRILVLHYVQTTGNTKNLLKKMINKSVTIRNRGVYKFQEIFVEIT